MNYAYLVPITMVFCSGACLGLALATHQLNQDFRKVSLLMMLILLTAAGVIAYMIGAHSGQAS